MNRQGAKAQRNEISEALNGLARAAVDCAFTVHSALGPGLLESVYEACLAHELTKRGLAVERQVLLPVRYDGIQIDAELRLDLLIENQLILELKAVENVQPIHTAQLLTYLKLTSLRLGLLINFNVPAIRLGIKRVIY
jgi:GxxExxY protein